MMNYRLSRGEGSANGIEPVAEQNVQEERRNTEKSSPPFCVPACPIFQYKGAAREHGKKRVARSNMKRLRGVRGQEFKVCSPRKALQLRAIGPHDEARRRIKKRRRVEHSEYQ